MQILTLINIKEVGIGKGFNLNTISIILYVTVMENQKIVAGELATK